MAKRRTIKTLAELHEMGNHIVQAAQNAMQEGAERIATDAINNAPIRTGKLRDSITITSNKKGDRYKISAKAFNETKTKKFYYGRKAELKKPFLYPALEAHKEEIYKNIKESISKAIGAE